MPPYLFPTYLYFNSMYSISSGSSTNPNLMSLIVLTATGVAFYAGFKHTNPTVQIKVLKSSNKLAIIYFRKVNYPNAVKITNKNINRLIEKGYTIKTKEEDNSYSTWSPIVSIDKKNVTIKQFINDCKECNVYTEVIYNYNTIISNNEKQKTKNFNWDIYYKNEEPIEDELK